MTHQEHTSSDNAVAVPLTRGFVAYVDAADAEAVLRYKWAAAIPNPRHPKNVYAVATIGGRRVYLHRFLLEYPPSKVDHKDRNTLNCRRSNLRPATSSQNLINRPMSSKNKSGYRGVYWFRPTQRWGVSIGINRRIKHLGYYDDPVKAAHAYDEAAKYLHGEFACLNFPDKAVPWPQRLEAATGGDPLVNEAPMKNVA